ncbi:MAG TPA: hypothetical protein VFJ82_00045 [Longimicrobium sp.]|nr:hypothetical protein [Longimicrobium sp.]
MGFLADPEFWEKVALLVAGAVLTGLLAPWIKARLDDGTARRKALEEARLARQAEVIASQIRLLEQFSTLAWKYLFSAFKVSYGYAAPEPQAQQRAACDEFASASWQLLMELRSVLSLATRLASPQTQAVLRATYEWMVTFDQEIWHNVRPASQLSTAEWYAFHEARFTDGGERVDRAIEALARDLRLASAQSTAGPAES